MQTEEKVKRMPAKAVTITSHKKVPGTHANSAVARLGAYLDLIYVGTIPPPETNCWVGTREPEVYGSYPWAELT